MNDLIQGLDDDGVLGKLDVLQIHAAPSEATGLMNWLSTSFNASENASNVVWTADRYAESDGTGTLSSGFVPSGSTQFQQDSAFYALWMLDELQTDTYHFGGTNTQFRPRSAINGRAGFRINSGTTTTIATTTSEGFWFVERPDSATQRLFRNNDSAALSSASVTSATPPAFAPGIFSNGSGVSPYKNLVFAAGGGGWTTAQRQALYNRLQTYLQAIGAVP